MPATDPQREYDDWCDEGYLKGSSVGTVMFTYDALEQTEKEWRDERRERAARLARKIPLGFCPPA